MSQTAWKKGTIIIVTPKYIVRIGETNDLKYLVACLVHSKYSNNVIVNNETFRIFTL